MSKPQGRTPQRESDGLSRARRGPIDHVRVRAVTLAIFLGLITLLVVLGREMPTDPAMMHPMMVRLR